MNIKYDQTFGDKFKTYIRIHCFTCKKDIASKGQLKPKHIGHEVRYVDREGNIDE